QIKHQSCRFIRVTQNNYQLNNGIYALEQLLEQLPSWEIAQQIVLTYICEKVDEVTIQL
ncbi:hypothetical protein ACJX0J_019531, partial [Zea mays]